MKFVLSTKTVILCCLLLTALPAVYSQTGNVGVGTNTPVEKLEVAGGIKIGHTTTENLGTLRWTENDHLEVFTLARLGNT